MQVNSAQCRQFESKIHISIYSKIFSGKKNHIHFAYKCSVRCVHKTVEFTTFRRLGWEGHVARILLVMEERGTNCLQVWRKSAVQNKWSLLYISIFICSSVSWMPQSCKTQKFTFAVMEKNITFHRLPVDDIERLKLWSCCTWLSTHPNILINNRVCSDHFSSVVLNFDPHQIITLIVLVGW